MRTALAAVLLLLSGCTTAQAQAWAAGMQAYRAPEAQQPAPQQAQPQNCTTERVGQNYYTHCY